MPGFGKLAAATGLAKNIDYVGQNQREFAQMENIEKEIAKNEQASMMAQELEAKQYEEIANKAAEMLEPDRIKIKTKSLELQKNIRAKIEEHGSRKAFYANGGIALLSKYKSDVLTSPETLGYLDNKKNMESLMKIQADGKGHLISDLDKKRLEDYNAGIGDGKITYSGMKSEVVIPEKYYNYGEDVPAEIILRSNYLPIYNNWLLDNPELSALQGDNLKIELLNYTYKNHYGQGTNMLKYQSDLANENLRKQQKALSVAGTGSKNEQEEIPISYTAAVNETFNQIQESTPATVASLMEPDNFLKKTAVKNKELSGLLGRVHEYIAADTNYVDADAIDAISNTITRSIGFDKKYTPASAVTVPMLSEANVIKALYPRSTPSGGVIANLNSEKFYAPNGNKLPEETVKKMIKEGLNQDMNFGGLIYAYIDDKDNLVTQVRNRKGESLGKKDPKGQYQLSEQERDHMNGFSGNLKNEMFAVLTTKDGDKVYQRIDVNSMKGEDDLSKAIGVADNVTQAVKRRQKSTILKQTKEIEKQWNAKILQNDAAIASAPGGIFSTPEFKSESQLSKVANGTNRYTLHKAYYMALSYLTEREGGAKGIINPDIMLSDKYYLKSSPYNFEKTVSYSPELKNALINKNKYSDIDFINLVAKVTASENPEDELHNQEIAQTWSKFYELLKKK